MLNFRRILLAGVALMAFATGRDACAGFVADPVSVGGTFVLEYRGEVAPSPGMRAESWILIPKPDAGQSPRLPVQPELAVEVNQYAVFGLAGGMTAGDVSSASSGPNASGLLESWPQTSGGSLTQYLVREWRTSIPVQFLSGVFRPPRGSV